MGRPVKPPEPFDEYVGGENRKWHRKAKIFFNGSLELWKFDVESFSVLEATTDRLDEYWRLQDDIKKEGYMIEGKRGSMRVNPLLVHSRAAYNGFLAGCKRLDLIPKKGSE